MNELYIFKLWNMVDRHIIRQTKRGKNFDRAITKLVCRELHFAIEFNTRLLTDA